MLGFYEFDSLKLSKIPVSHSAMLPIEWATGNTLNKL